MSTAELLQEARARQAYRAKVLAWMSFHYHFVDPSTVVAKQCALAGNVYAYLSQVLDEPNTWHFKKRIAKTLQEAGLARRVSSYGYVWLKGLIANDPSQDLKIATKVGAQHRKAMKAYRSRHAKVSI